MDIQKLSESELIKEINILANKKELSVKDKELQNNLRKEYISRIKSGLKAHLEYIKPTDK